MEHALCTLDNKGCKHTFVISNNYCFPTAPKGRVAQFVVSGTRSVAVFRLQHLHSWPETQTSQGLRWGPMGLPKSRVLFAVCFVSISINFTAPVDGVHEGHDLKCVSGYSKWHRCKLVKSAYCATVVPCSVQKLLPPGCFLHVLFRALLLTTADTPIPV